MTGLRISELLGLTWCDVDFDNARLHIKKAKVLGQYKAPKTKGSIRSVELNRHALALLRELYKTTGQRRGRKIAVLQLDNKTKRSELVRPVFINTKTNNPFLHSAQYGKTFFDAFLKQAGVSHRGANQLRHTFASQCLTNGISKEWIARQLGHNTTQMVDIHYGRWLQGDAPDNAGKFGDAMASVFSSTPKASPEANNSQRKTTSSWAAHSCSNHLWSVPSRHQNEMLSRPFASQRKGGRAHA